MEPVTLTIAGFALYALLTKKQAASPVTPTNATWLTPAKVTPPFNPVIGGTPANGASTTFAASPSQVTIPTAAAPIKIPVVTPGIKIAVSDPAPTSFDLGDGSVLISDPPIVDGIWGGTPADHGSFMGDTVMIAEPAPTKFYSSQPVPTLPAVLPNDTSTYTGIPTPSYSDLYEQQLNAQIAAQNAAAAAQAAATAEAQRNAIAVAQPDEFVAPFVAPVVPTVTEFANLGVTLPASYQNPDVPIQQQNADLLELITGIPNQPAVTSSDDAAKQAGIAAALAQIARSKQMQQPAGSNFGAY